MTHADIRELTNPPPPSYWLAALGKEDEIETLDLLWLRTQELCNASPARAGLYLYDALYHIVSSPHSQTNISAIKHLFQQCLHRHMIFCVAIRCRALPLALELLGIDVELVTLGDYEAFHLLLTTDSRTPGYYELLNTCLILGANVNHAFRLRNIRRYESPLHIAVSRENYTLVRYLLDRGARLSFLRNDAKTLEKLWFMLNEDYRRIHFTHPTFLARWITSPQPRTRGLEQIHRFVYPHQVMYRLQEGTLNSDSVLTRYFTEDAMSEQHLIGLTGQFL